jgi:predicted RecA/RadA family phage recombinase
VAIAIGSLVVVPTNTIAAGLPFEGVAEGILPLSKLAGTAWTEGEILYFDTADGKFKTATNATAFRAGTAAAAAQAADITGSVRLNGVSAPVNVA